LQSATKVHPKIFDKREDQIELLAEEMKLVLNASEWPERRYAPSGGDNRLKYTLASGESIQVDTA
jgi:hypothetical protein